MASTRTAHLACTSTAGCTAPEPLRNLKTSTSSTSLEKSSARPIPSASDGTDSGYATQTSTPNDPEKDNQPRFAIAPSFRKHLFKKEIALREYQHLSVSEAAWIRFRDLQKVLFGRPLFEYIAKKHPKLLLKNRGQLLDCSFRLVMVGETEASATPRIVVQCDKSIVKTVRRYFGQPNIKEQYEPPEEDNVFPSLQLHVFDKAPVKMSATDQIPVWLAYAPITNSDVIAIVKVEDNSGERYATIGGAIEVVDELGNVKRWGLTVGHIFNTELPPRKTHTMLPNHPDIAASNYKQAQMSGDDEESSSDDASSVFDDETDGGTEFVLESGTTTAHLPSGSVSSIFNSERFTQSLAVTAGHGASLSHHSHDWAIVDAPGVHPSPFRLPQGDSRLRFRENRQVTIYSGSAGPRLGSLSARSTFVMSGMDGSVIEIHTLKLRDRSVINQGDCGSWVVDVANAVVYGYVTASDAFGDAYVMPIETVLQDIKTALGARHVNLYNLPELQPQTPIRRVQPASSCGSLNGLIHSQGRVFDSGYATASNTPEETRHSTTISMSREGPSESPSSSSHAGPKTFDRLPEGFLFHPSPPSIHIHNADAVSNKSSGINGSDHDSVFDPALTTGDDQMDSSFTSPDYTPHFLSPTSDHGQLPPRQGPSRWRAIKAVLSKWKRSLSSGKNNMKVTKKDDNIDAA